MSQEFEKEWERVLKKLPAFYQAARRGQNDKLLAALRKGAQVNALDPVGYSALCGAAAEGHLETVRLLLDHGADPNLANRSGGTSLMSAASFSHVETVRLLLERGADPNAAGFRGETVLLRVRCDQGCERPLADERIRQVVYALVCAGANVNQADDRGRTPLMHFVRLGLPDVVELLLEQGADASARDREGSTSLLLAAQRGEAGEALVELLLDHGASAVNAAGESLVARRDAPLNEVWNAYWARTLEDPFECQVAHFGMGRSFLDSQLELLRQRGVRRVLLVGNGCSLQPHALAHVGFEVTVVDLSSVANRSVSQAHPTPELLAGFLPGYTTRKERGIGTVQVFDPEASLRRVAREAASGGSVTFVTADIMDWETGETFDCIYDDRLAAVLPPESWPALADRYARLLTPDGLCFVETLNLGGGLGGSEAPCLQTALSVAFTSSGFREASPKTNGPARGLEVRFIHGSG
ncbi:MAG: ankyrin repeat and box protein 3-like [Armatimonadetes bacterium]|nr:ankyrin repeat and box protein 3-like [Armatimonadota bacterium]